MNKYIGTKMFNAKSMNLMDYSGFVCCELPEDQDGVNEGYLVECVGGGNPNHPDYENYISWCPKKQFESVYQTSGSMSFGHAVEMLKLGYKVARSGWNGKSMFLFLVDGSTFKVNRPPLLGIFDEGTEIDYCPHIDMKTADGKIVPWLASQSDVLEEDWCIVE